MLKIQFYIFQGVSKISEGSPNTLTRYPIFQISQMANPTIQLFTFLKSLDLPQTPCEGIFHAPRPLEKLVMRTGCKIMVNISTTCIIANFIIPLLAHPVPVNILVTAQNKNFDFPTSTGNYKDFDWDLEFGLRLVNKIRPKLRFIPQIRDLRLS